MIPSSRSNVKNATEFLFETNLLVAPLEIVAQFALIILTSTLGFAHEFILCPDERSRDVEFKRKRRAALVALEHDHRRVDEQNGARPRG